MIETEGFPIDSKEKKRFTELKERALMKKLNSTMPPSPMNGPGATGGNDDRDSHAQIFVSNLDKDAANTMPVDSNGNDANKMATHNSDDRMMAPSYAQSPDVGSLGTLGTL